LSGSAMHVPTVPLVASGSAEFGKSGPQHVDN
jgi:hypothetical protein